MTQNELLQMAEQAGFQRNVVQMMIPQLTKFAELASLTGAQISSEPKQAATQGAQEALDLVLKTVAFMKEQLAKNSQ